MLQHMLGPLTGGAYVLLRVVSGLAFAFHGVQKHFGYQREGPAPEFGSQIWIGGWIELVTGSLMALGLFTRWAAFLASGTMAVAYVQFHWRFQLGPQFFPTINKGELALIYAFVFFYIACRGPGRMSLDPVPPPRAPAR